VAITKDQFIQSAVNQIANYPTISKRFQIGDPLITQAMAAMAAMLADLSNQVEVTAGEVYLKARDVTVLADASVKGVLPFATPAIASITLTNGSPAPVQVLAGRVLLDQGGRYWRVITGTTVPAGQSGVLIAKQVQLRQLIHSVTQYMPFYTVELSAPEVGYIAEVMVVGYEYTPEFSNVAAGDAVYHIQSDETQTLGLVFGLEGVAGRQPAMGEQLSLSIYDTEGDISLNVGMAFTFEYLGSANDALVNLTLAEVSQSGAAPMDIVTMREVCSYPGIYNENAVYLSNFDFVIRKKISPVAFLSIWNEMREEEVRGASLDNINALYVAALKDGTSTATLQEQITRIIQTADDSYRIHFVPVVEKVVPITLTLIIPSTYDAASVKQDVAALVLENYGRSSAWAKRGEARILRKDMYDLFRKNVPALTQRIADITIETIGDGSNVLPEQFRYVTEDSLTINTVEAD